MLRILEKIHLGSETSEKQGSGYGSEQKSFRIHNTVVCRAVARYTGILVLLVTILLGYLKKIEFIYFSYV